MKLLPGKLSQCFRRPKLLVPLAGVVCLAVALLFMYPAHAAASDTGWQCKWSSDGSTEACIEEYNGTIYTYYDLSCNYTFGNISGAIVIRNERAGVIASTQLRGNNCMRDWGSKLSPSSGKIYYSEVVVQTDVREDVSSPTITAG